MKKYMIRCDIEGVSGVVSYEQAEPGKPEYEFGKKMFLSDLLALIEGLNNGGADEIVIYDEHYYGRNIDIDRLPENATAICGKPPYRPEWAGGLDESFSGLILLGFHSKTGTGELLHHSYEPDIKDLILNGVSIGEIGIETAIAGDFQVPLVMITADSAGIEEAKQLVPEVVGVTVKESFSETGGLCYPTSMTSKSIRSAAEEIVKNPPATKPYQLQENNELRIEFNNGPYLEAFRNLFQNVMATENSISLTGATVTEIWSAYWAMKLKTQEQL